ncbi:MAG: hypothetical protein U0637_11360 [Phycisphaerales bacterium]
MTATRSTTLVSAALLLLALCAPHTHAQCNTTQVALFGGDAMHVVDIGLSRVVVSRGDKLDAVNVANAASPVVLSTAPLLEEVVELKSAAPYVYALIMPGNNFNNRQIVVLDYTFDVPLYVTTIPVPMAYDFDVFGSRMAVARADSFPTRMGVDHYDVTDPANPLLRSSYSFIPLGVEPRFISLTDTRTFVTDVGSFNSQPNDVHVWMFNSSNMAAPVLQTSFLQSNAQDVLDMAAGANHVYLARRTSLDTLNITSPGAPVISSTIPLAPERVVVSGTTLFAAVGMDGVRAYSLANPAAPALLGSLDTAGRVHDIALRTNRIFAAADDGGLIGIDRTNPAAMSVLGVSTLPASTVWDLAPIGNLAYASEDFGLRIYDVTNTASPVLLGGFAYTTPFTCASRVLTVANSNAYIGGCAGTLRVLNINNPAAITQRALVNISGGIDYDMVVSGNFLYGGSGNGLKVVDISNPNAPFLLTTYAVPGPVFNVKVSGTNAFLATRDNGVWIVSIANPAAPQLIGFADFTPAETTRDLALSGTTAYVARSSRIEVINVANPSSPQLVTTFDDPGVSSSVGNALSLSGNTLAAYGAAAVGDVAYLYDVSQPAAPLLFNTVPLPHANTHFARLGGPRLFADNGDSGLAIFSLQAQYQPVFTTQPSGIPGQCRGGHMTFNTATRANPALTTYQWKKNGSLLVADGHYLGLDSPQLVVLNSGPLDAGSYTCEATNSCGTTASAPAVVTMSQCDCIDFNYDLLFPDTADFDDFLSVFSGGPCSTNLCRDIDFNNDGLFPDTADIDSFLSVFSGGPCL